MERVKKVHLEWVKIGHRGQNTNNVSATITIKPDEWEPVGEWMWENNITIMVCPSFLIQITYKQGLRGRTKEEEKLLPLERSKLR